MLGREDVDLAARGDSAAMRRVLLDLIDHGNGLAGQMGYDPSASPSSNPGVNIAAPQPPTINVTAADGHVLVTLTNPPTGFSNVAGTYRVEPAFGFQGVDFQGQQMQVLQSMTPNLTPVNDPSLARRIFHQLESSTNLNFDADGAVTIYGPSTSLNYDITDPVTTKYWRVKSRFENSDFCQYTYFTNAATCGPVAVFSGFLKSSSAAIAMAFNQTNFATVTSSDSGTDATILVYGVGGPGTTWTRPAGQGTTGPYPAANLLHFAYNTDYYVSYDTVALAYTVSTTLPATLPDTMVPAGKVHTLSAGGVGSGASGTAILSGTTIASITVNAGGAAYATPPTVVISGGGGSGAAATAVLTGNAVTSVTVNNAGTGYTSQPTIQFTGGGGSGAVATAVLTATSVASITVTSGGSGYNVAPTVTIAGNATATANIVGGAVVSISMTSGGSGYTTPPAVTITGSAAGISGGGGVTGSNHGRFMDLGA